MPIGPPNTSLRPFALSRAFGLPNGEEHSGEPAIDNRRKKSALNFFKMGIILQIILFLVRFPLSFIISTSQFNQAEKALILLTSFSRARLSRLQVGTAALIAVILGVTFFSAVMTNFPSFTWNRYISSLVSLFAVLLPLAIFVPKEDCLFSYRAWAWAPTATVLFGALLHLSGFREIYIVDYLVGGTRLQGSNIAAGLGSAGYVGTIGCLIVAKESNGKYLFLAGINTLIVMLTGSRMAFALSAIILVVGYFFFLRLQPSKKIAMAAILLMMGSGTLYFFGGQILDRFNSGSSSGRDLIAYELELIQSQYPDFGIGLGHQGEVMNEDLARRTATIAAHNEYLRLSLEVGTIQSVIIFAIIFIILLRYILIYNAARSLFFITVCGSFFIYCMTDNAISSSVTFYGLFHVCSWARWKAASERLANRPRMEAAFPQRNDLAFQRSRQIGM